MSSNSESRPRAAGDGIRVVHVTNVVAPDKLGGLERYVRELGAALAERGDHVVIVAKTHANRFPAVELTDDGITIVRYRTPSKRNPLFALLYPVAISRAVLRGLKIGGATRRALRAGEVVLHGHFPVPMLPAALTGRPYVYTMHAPVFKELLGERQGSYALPRPLQAPAVRALEAVERLVLRRATRVITLSRFVADEVRDLAGASVPLVQIQGGIDVQRFSPGAKISQPGSPVLFCARRLVERTGVELLIEAMRAVVAELPDAQLYLAGAGPRQSAIKALISRLGLASNVTLLGRVSDDDLLSWYRSADLCVTPTLYLEGFGLSTAEALAVGTPTVVTPAGANAELVATLPAQLLAARVDATALAEAIIASWTTLQVDEIAEQARRAIAPSMGWPAVAAAHDALYTEVTSTLAKRR